VTGATFAVAGEPDLDGVIRFHDPVSHRSHGPAVGVQVTRVSIDGRSQAGHALTGADVDLLGDARFHERNGTIARSGEAAIHPFTIQVSGNDVLLRRTDLWDPRQPELEVYEVPPRLLRRRQPTHTGQGMFEMNSPDVADATGIADFQGYFETRQRALESELEGTLNETQRVALERRISAIRTADWRVLFRLGFRAPYSFALNGRPEVEDEFGRLEGRPLTSPYWLPHWPLRFWFGGFDSDALCGYVRGTLDVPFEARAR
jgi:hypothetical protein